MTWPQPQCTAARGSKTVAARKIIGLEAFWIVSPLHNTTELEAGWTMTCQGTN